MYVIIVGVAASFTVFLATLVYCCSQLTRYGVCMTNITNIADCY
jgi:hypothetical protein